MIRSVYVFCSTWYNSMMTKFRRLPLNFFLVRPVSPDFQNEDFRSMHYTTTLPTWMIPVEVLAVQSMRRARQSKNEMDSDP